MYLVIMVFLKIPLNGDPYHCFCLKTTRLVKEKMKLNDDEIITTFQSRFGREEWLNHIRLKL